MKVYNPLQVLLSASSFSLFTAVVAVTRNITVTNNCAFTIWYIYTSMGTIPDHPTGWAAPSHSSVSFTVPGNWSYGQIWARRDCDFDKNPNPHSCLVGGCPGGVLQCDGPPIAPATIAEFALSTNPNVSDHYTVSLSSGYNLPMIIENDTGCGVPQCRADLALNCPAPLKGPLSSIGFPVGCNSACAAHLALDPSNDPNCCTGEYHSAATCPTSGVQYYSYFKTKCPDTSVYLFDSENEGPSGTSVFTCASAFQADYTVTFCPPKKS
ncbi:thaumatin [Lactarius quietus]|nr:thaumatin [Lactarius quietus]